MSTQLQDPPAAPPRPAPDYSLVGENATRAVERGLAEADWYQCPVPRAELRKLLERRDGPALRDTAIWLGLLAATGGATVWLWPSWWAALPYLVYAVLYGSSADARWHEAGHGTAFRTDWMNNALYELGSFMMLRESVVWRWSHTRHHSDTIIVGRDPEISVPRPPDLLGMGINIFSLTRYPKYFVSLFRHAAGRMSAEEKTFVPEEEFPRVFLRARIYVAIYAGTLVLSLALGSWLPLLLIVVPAVLGAWLGPVYGLTQHAGLAEDVLDHRLNCRTIHMNFINRFLYWNMNYHVEHHMFPLVPYHALPRLHELVKDDCPPAYPSLLSAWQEIVPAVLRQRNDPAYHVKRKLPDPAPNAVAESAVSSDATPDADGWLEVCAAADLGPSDVLRFDHAKKTFALYRDADGTLHATDGICTHGNTHLADGLVIGGQIECPKHNGRFNLADGSPARAPICRAIATYPLEERNRRLWLNVEEAGGEGARETETHHLRVVSNRSVATFIKELVLEPVTPGEAVAFDAGDYLQIEIPAYGSISFRDMDIPEPYASVWERQGVFNLVARNPDGPDAAPRRNNYSLASNPSTDGNQLRFNVRIATPPPGQDCDPGVGSAYIFGLQPGDEVSAIGPFGDFHVKPTQREAVYIGGGAGMAPLRAHLSHLLETQETARRVSFWYGARSRQEVFYDDFFEDLAERKRNFNFHVALSSPLEEDAWEGHTGFIHEVVRDDHLAQHRDPTKVEYFLCGPPMMIKATTKMLADLGVPAHQIAYDAF